MGNHSAELNRFLTNVERKAFAMARLALGNPDDAMDVVQDSMLNLARRYARRPPDQWRPLFFRILKNAIRDHYRRQASFFKRFTLMGGLAGNDDAAVDLNDWFPGRDTDQPEMREQLSAATEQAEAAVRQLPGRQREAFLLRSWEGLSVAETAIAMQCSEGSVKTHHSRALARLREILGDHWP